MPCSEALRADQAGGEERDSAVILMIECALFEPDIPHNTGAILRLGACFGMPVI